MAKLTLLQMITGYLSATSYNANNTLIEAALENTLSRDGTTPNTMTAALDLNSNDINNVATLTATSATVNGVDMGVQATNAAASAAAASASETNAATSETNAAVSAAAALASETAAGAITGAGDGDFNGILIQAKSNIQFPATQSASSDANTLDDYEEGTWTPTLDDSTTQGASGQTYSVQTGHYQKVGTRIYLQGYIAMTSIGTLSGNAHITGLPFAAHLSASSLGSVSIAFTQNLNLTTAGHLHGAVPSSQTAAILYSTSATTGSVNITCAEVSSNGEIRFTMDYLAED